MKETWAFMKVTGFVFILSFYLGWASNMVVWCWKLGWGWVDLLP